MADDSTTYEIDIPVNGDSADSAAEKVARLATRLEESGRASEVAAAAVKAAEGAYRQAEAAADRASKSLEKITVAADAQKGKLQAALDAGDASGVEKAAAKLKDLTARQSDATQKSQAAKAALDAEAASLDKLKAAAQNAATQEEKISKAHQDAAKAADQIKKAEDSAAGSGKVNEIAEGFGKLGGPLGRIGQQAFGAAEGFKKLGASLGSAGPYVAIAVALFAISTAAIAATIAILNFAIANGDEARSQSLLSQGIAQSVVGGELLENQIDALSNKLPQSREELRGMAADLAKTGLQGQALSDALEDAATKAAKSKFGPNWKAQVQSLAKQSENFKKSLADLFKVKNLEPLLAGVQQFVALFDKGSVTGKAMGDVFQAFIQKLVDGAAALVPKIIAGFIQLEILALKVAIKVKSHWSTIVAVFEAVGVAILVVVGVIALLVGIVVGVAAVAGALVVGLIYLGGVFLDLASKVAEFVILMVTEPGKAFDLVKGKIDEAISYLSSISLAEIGSQMIAGLVQGITNGGAAVLAAITGIASGAIDSAKKALGIASPSTVFAEIGMQTAAGMSEGVDGGQSNVQGALESLVAAPAAPAAPAGASSGSSSSSLPPLTVILNGVQGAQDAVEQFRDTLVKVLSGDRTQLGLEEAPVA